MSLIDGDNPKMSKLRPTLNRRPEERLEFASYFQNFMDRVRRIRNWHNEWFSVMRDDNMIDSIDVGGITKLALVHFLTNEFYNNEESLENMRTSIKQADQELKGELSSYCETANVTDKTVSRDTRGKHLKKARG